MRIANLAAALVGSCLFVAGSLAAVGEIAPYGSLHGTDTEQIAAMRTGDVRPGLSLGSKHVLLRECSALSQSPVTRVQRTAVREDLLEICHDMASGMTGRMPTFSEAWLTRAIASIERNDDAAFNAELATARNLAAHVHWLAYARVRVADSHYDRLDAENQAGHLRDLRALADSFSGLEALAGFYLERPRTRDRVTAIMETATPTAQRQFLNLVQQYAAEGRGRD